MASGKVCKVMTFINPHTFYVIYEENERDLKPIKEALARNFRLVQVSSPKTHTLYTVQHEGKVKRVVILREKEGLYVCRTIDYGKVIKTDVVYELPAECTMKALSFRAGLKVVPLEAVLSKDTKNFILGLISTSKRTTFEETEVLNGVHFGHLILTDRNNVEYDLIEKLVQDKFVVIDNKKFNESFKRSDDDSCLDSGVGRGHRRESRKLISPIPKPSSYVEDWVRNTSLTSSSSAEDKVPDLDETINFSDEEKSQQHKSKSSFTIKDKCSKKQNKTNEPISQPKELKLAVKNSIMIEEKINLIPGGASIGLSKASKSSAHSKRSTSSYSDSEIEDVVLLRGKSSTESLNFSGRNKNKDGRISKMSLESENSNEMRGIESRSEDESFEDIKVQEKSRSTSPTSMDENVPKFSQNNRRQPNMPKFGCNCSDCLMWNIRDFDTIREEHQPIPRPEIIKPELLFRTDDEEERPDVNNMTVITKNMVELRRSAMQPILAHGPVIPHPVTRVKDVPFDEVVHKTLEKLSYSKCKPIQMYSWPALMKGMNLCMVHSPETGKSITYIPVLFSFLTESNRYSYKELPTKSKGPIALVLCPHTLMAEEVYDLFTVFRRSLPRDRMNIALAIPPIDKDVTEQFKKGCDILVTTPSVLLALLSSQVIDLKRLCHLVVERIDDLLAKQQPVMTTVFNVVQEMLKHRNCRNQVQLITTAENWSKRVEERMSKLRTILLVCIGNHIQAALYGRADIIIEDVEIKNRALHLLDILREKYQIYKTLVLCRQDEMEEITKLMQLYNIRSVIADETMQGEDVRDMQKAWQSTVNGANIVLVTTDNVLKMHLNITNAAMLINYSLTDTWSSFVQRFSCLIDNYDSPLAPKKSTSFNCKIHIFINNDYATEYPKIIGYFHNIGAEFPTKCLEYYKKYLNKKEQDKVIENIHLCPFLLTFGECSQTHCRHRHILSASIDQNQEAVRSGTIKFKILNVIKVNKFAVRLLECCDYNGNIYSFPNHIDKIKSILEESHFEFANDVKLGGKYIIDDGGVLRRCKVAKVYEAGRITGDPVEVGVVGLDEVFSRKVNVSLLMKLPASLQHFGKTYTEIYLSNMIPLNNEPDWTHRARKLIFKTLSNVDYDCDESYCSGNILLWLKQGVWVDDIHVQQYLSTCKMSVNKLIFKKFLSERNLVEVSDIPMQKLRELCEVAMIPLPELKPKQVKVVKQIDPQWAHFDDCGNLVYFSYAVHPGNLFVRLFKYDNLLEQLKTAIEEYVNTKVFSKTEIAKDDVILGNCYLAPDLDGSGNFDRVIVTNICETTVECFFVDYGDVNDVNISELKHIPDMLIQKLPFQAIQCKLHGLLPIKETWSDDVTNVLYDQYCFERGTNIYKKLYAHHTASNQGVLSNTHYNIMLYDVSQKSPVIINKILVDSGLALEESNGVLETRFDIVSILEKYDKTDEELFSDEEEFIESDITGEQKMVEDALQIDEDDIDSDNGDFDVRIIDASKFYQEMKRNSSTPKPESTLSRRIEAAPSNPTVSTPPNLESSISSSGNGEGLLPDVLWHQTNTHVKIDVRLSVSDYKVSLLQGRLLFFSAKQNDRPYSLSLCLYEPVSKSMTHSSSGFVIRITLSKVNKSDWPRLVQSEKPMWNVRYDVDKIVIPEEEKRKLFDLGDEFDEKIIDDDDYIADLGSDNYTDSELELSQDEE